MTTIDDLKVGHQYCFINVEARTVIDLSGGDNRSIIGWPQHNGSNQIWRMGLLRSHWVFQNVGSNKYLSIEGGPGNGTKVVASDEPFAWDIEHADNSQGVLQYIRIVVPYTAYNLDLSDHGSATPGTPITLWSKHDGKNQRWKFQEL